MLCVLENLAGTGVVYVGWYFACEVDNTQMHGMRVAAGYMGKF
jgi:hypothetical protein